MKIEFIYQLVNGIFILYFVIIFLFYYRKINQKRQIDNLKTYTFDFCTKDDTNYEKFMINYFDHKGWKTTDDATFMILANFDKISIALKHRVFHEEIIYDYYAKYFIQFYSEFQFFIIQRREMTANPDLFIEYEKLVRRWKNNFKNFKIDL
ncbi:hypothetical protein J2786_002169 [Chryseobacterium vietnamense]|uniref:Uncharacterized protein n=1 Tax=Chryseobacterium vietnamense TaxID=866785 RepID=A0ACC6J7P4_9FLAO|nr:DUF4760 domain-containing protein [Chryseobacterium vietnamense]MDR6459062.1 hypothetical protein [Chryseobacterium vietnamense]